MGKMTYDVYVTNIGCIESGASLKHARSRAATYCRAIRNGRSRGEWPVFIMNCNGDLIAEWDGRKPSEEIQ